MNEYMKFVIVFILFFSANASAQTRQTISIKEVALSMNTKRVFVVSNETITGSSCSENAYLSIALPNPEAYLFYSAALSAMNENKKMRIQYSNSECVNNGSKVEVFWNLNQ